MTKSKKIILILSMIAILFISFYFLTTTKVQRVTKTTWKQASDIESILIESNIVCKEIKWSKANAERSDKEVFACYDIFDDNGKEYIMTLRLPAKQVYRIYNQTDKIEIYVNEELYPKRPL